MDFELVLAHLRRAWIDKNATNLIAYMKLATMVGFNLFDIKKKDETEIYASCFLQFNLYCCMRSRYRTMKNYLLQKREWTI